MKPTKEYLNRKEEYRIKNREDLKLRKKEVSEILTKYSLNGDYYGENSPFGKGKEGSQEFGRVINNLFAGHKLTTLLEYDISEEVSYSRIFPFRYQRDEIQKLGINGWEYNFPPMMRGEDAFNRLVLANKILIGYKKNPIQKNDITNILKLGSKSIITRAEDFLSLCDGWSFDVDERKKHRRYFEKIISLKENNLAEQWKESWDWINYIAKTAPKLKNFESLENEISSYLLEKFEKENSFSL